jgi:ATP-binding cassette subfamily B protein
MAAEEEVLGKAYDSRMMGRLMRYLGPYRLQVALAMAAIILKAGADVLSPFLVKTAIDKYLSSQAGGHSFLDPLLSSQPLVGIAQVSGIYLGVLLLGFIFEFTQTYLMQWTGQKVMFDLRSQLYRHLQRMDIAFFDRNPVGRLVTRVTTDVDALNDMFTSGVVSIVEDVFVLAGILADRLPGTAHHRDRHADVPQIGARQLPADSSGDCAYQQLFAGARQRHHSSATVQPRAQVV